MTGTVAVGHNPPADQPKKRGRKPQLAGQSKPALARHTDWKGHSVWGPSSACSRASHPDAWPLSHFKVGDRVEGWVTNMTRAFIFVDFGATHDGTLKLDRKDSRQPALAQGSWVDCLRVASISPEQGKASLEFREPDEEDVQAKLIWEWGKCLALYVHGSATFSNKPPSDIDLLAVVDEPTYRPIPVGTPEAQFKLGKYEVSVYPRSVWLQKLAEMDLTLVTTMSIPERFVLFESDPELRKASIDPGKLYSTISAYAEFTYSKARFMLTMRTDMHKCMKNLYFVCRVLELGRQLLTHGRIVDFCAANHWWDRMEKLNKELEEMQQASPLSRFQKWSFLEVCLGGDMREEFVKFDNTMTEVFQTVLPPTLPQGLVSRVVQFLAVPSDVCEQRPAMRAGIEDLPCGICSTPVASADDTVVTLPRCGHRFLRKCAYSKILEETNPEAEQLCWVCEQPRCLSLDKDAYQDEESQTRASNGRPRRFAGYPATVTLWY